MARLVVDAGVVVLAQVGDQVQSDVRELLVERGGQAVPLAGGVAAHVDGDLAALGLGRLVERLELVLLARGGGPVRGRVGHGGRGDCGEGQGGGDGRADQLVPVLHGVVLPFLCRQSFDVSNVAMCSTLCRLV
ncbi:hypothetical protein ACRAWF_20190 [Streptomyces sp. L7]